MVTSPKLPWLQVTPGELAHPLPGVCAAWMHVHVGFDKQPTGMGRHW